jgi:hypothetical protein
MAYEIRLLLEKKELRRVSEDPPAMTVRFYGVMAGEGSRIRRRGMGQVEKKRDTKSLKFMVIRIAVCMILSVWFCGWQAPSARAEDHGAYVLSIKDHKFQPQQLAVPANRKFTLTVKNLDTTPSEFESNDLSREKVVKAGGEIEVFLGPLDPGTYTFFDDFHRETTGTLKAQ